MSASQIAAEVAPEGGRYLWLLARASGRRGVALPSSVGEQTDTSYAGGCTLPMPPPGSTPECCLRNLPTPVREENLRSVCVCVWKKGGGGRYCRQDGALPPQWGGEMALRQHWGEEEGADIVGRSHLLRPEVLIISIKSDGWIPSESLLPLLTLPPQTLYSRGLKPGTCLTSCNSGAVNGRFRALLDIRAQRSFKVGTLKTPTSQLRSSLTVWADTHVLAHALLTVQVSTGALKRLTARPTRTRDGDPRPSRTEVRRPGPNGPEPHWSGNAVTRQMSVTHTYAPQISTLRPLASTRHLPGCQLSPSYPLLITPSSSLQPDISQVVNPSYPATSYHPLTPRYNQTFPQLLSLVILTPSFLKPHPHINQIHPCCKPFSPNLSGLIIISSSEISEIRSFTTVDDDSFAWSSSSSMKSVRSSESRGSRKGAGSCPWVLDCSSSTTAAVIWSSITGLRYRFRIQWLLGRIPATAKTLHTTAGYGGVLFVLAIEMLLSSWWKVWEDSQWQ
uniref:Uncharacterized protein n=1 Tax=Timema monikensis TaxID=170555 RepID=A0A7R9EAL2_9NEOP|nr:unnamed protein product [Timema monikensis]